MADDDAAPDQIEIAEAVASLASIVLAHESFELVLEHLTGIAKRTVPGAFEVSITMRDRDPFTVATTAEFATMVDASQYSAGHGPCLEALHLGETVVVDDQSTESRWPEYSPRAADAGVRSSVSVPLQVGEEYIAALNIYGDEPHAFQADEVAAAENLAVYAGVVLNNADMYYSATMLADQMAEAMGSRAIIEQAKGALMAIRRCTADEAFAFLVEISQSSHRKLRAIAQEMIDEISSES